MASRLLGGYFVGGEMTVNRAACFVFNDYHRTSSVTNMISKLGWQDLETRGRISALIIVFKIQTGHVKIPFPNDLLETASPCATRASTQHPFQYQRFLSNNNTHKFSFFVRAVPVWNALSPTSVYADNVNAFYSSFCGKLPF